MVRQPNVQRAYFLLAFESKLAKRLPETVHTYL